LVFMGSFRSLRFSFCNRINLEEPDRTRCWVVRSESFKLRIGDKWQGHARCRWEALFRVGEKN
jgi:hypothetical protein